MPNRKPPTRRELENQKRIAEIRSAALRLFTEKGYDGTTLEAVASELGYTKQALYYYFKNKDALVRSLLQDSLDQALARMEEILEASPSPKDNLRDLVDYYLEEHLEGRGFYHVFHHVQTLMDQLLQDQASLDLKAAMGRFNQLVMGILERGVAQGDFRQEDPRVLGSLVLSMVTGVVQQASGPMLRAVPPQVLRKSVMEIIMKGVCL